MDEEASIAQGLRETDGNARYDASCKRILSEKSILARIMKACLEEYKDCDVDEIAEKYIEGTPEVSTVPVMPGEGGGMIQGMDTVDKSAREGVVTYDIRFRAIVPGTGERITLIINVEAQYEFNPGYPLIMRGIYYCCRMVSAQHEREFSGSHYERIKKVYSIWICMKPSKGWKNTITRYRLTEENLVGEAAEPVEHYDLLSVIMLCLGDPESENYESVLRMLDVLLISDKSEAEKRRILQDEFHIQMTRTMDEELTAMCNLSQGIEARGIAKGEARGIAKGERNTRMIALEAFIKMGLSREQAMGAMKIPKDEWPLYMQLLDQQSC